MLIVLLVVLAALCRGQPSGRLHEMPGQQLLTPPHDLSTRFWTQDELCFDNVTCDGRCGPQSYYPNSDRVMCYCDVYCSHYGDCCPMTEQRSCPDTLEVKEIIHASQYSTCGWITQNGMELPDLFMVGKCPADSAPWLKDRCERETEGTDSLVLQVPVGHYSIALIYKNVYCAQCHGVDFTDVYFWSLHDERDLTTHLMINNFILTDRLGYDLQTYSYDDYVRRGFRMCMRQTQFFDCSSYGNHVAWNYNLCPENADPEISGNCRKYDYPALVGNVWYKNRFCAECQNATKDLAPVTQCEITNIRYDLIRCFGNKGVPGSNLADLFLAPSPCPNGQFKDPVTGECRFPVMCRPGFILWNNKCIRDPYNTDVYTYPESRDLDGILIEYTLNTDREFMTVTWDYDGTLTEIIHSLAWTLIQVVEEGLALNQNGVLIRLDMPNPETRTLLGATDVYIPENTEMTLLFWHPQQFLLADDFLKMIGNNDTVRYMQARFHHEVRETLHIWSRNIYLPVICETGSHISVPVDDDMWSYLRFAEKKHSFPNLVLEYDQETNETFVHLCDTMDQKFHDCNLVNYSLSDFDIYSDRIVHMTTSYMFMNTSFYVSDGMVYVCANNDPLHSNEGLNWITQIGLILSNVFLIITFLTYFFLSKLRALPGMMIMNLCVVLFVAQLIFLIVMNVENLGPVCQPLAIVAHYAWLSVFFWMNSIAINTYRAFRKLLKSSGSKTKYLVIFSLYSYVAPLIIVAICSALHFSDIVPVYAGGLNGETQPGICWIYSDSVRAFAFILPLALLVAGNMCLFILTFNIIRRTQKETAMATDGMNTRDVIIYVKLSLLLGFTWVFGVIGSIWPNIVILYLFVILNSLNGLLIGIGFVCTKRVFQMCRSRGRDISTKRTNISVVSSQNGNEQGGKYVSHEKRSDGL